MRVYMFKAFSKRERREFAKLSTAEACGHPGARGPCIGRIQDGKCIWCERELDKVGAA